jgi:hypothetical protein
MMLAMLIGLASVDDVASGGPLTLLFPLVLVFVIALLWWISFRRSRNE